MMESTVKRWMETKPTHLHKWRKVAGQNKVYCQVKGCDLTRLVYEAGTKVPWTGKTTHHVYTRDFGRGEKVDEVARECFHCGVYLPVDAEGNLKHRHICDGAEGKARRDRTTNEAMKALNAFFFGGRIQKVDKAAEPSPGGEEK